jgi:hypothetical protein
MSDNLSDVIVISIIWIACGAVGVATQEVTPLVFAVLATVLYVGYSR